ncbi:metallopeptidase family M24-domain-containing protein [Hypoxylon sp. NC1633]|nr:metallopeptidase family M24-domain-containing protein [Hypoxylon sp. NC1633]
MTTTLDHHAFRCRSRGLLHSAVSAAVAIVLSLPFMSRLPLTDVVGRRSIEIDVAELEAKEEEPIKKYPAKLHARKVAKELGVDNGLIYLPGQLESTWEDSDQGPPFRQRRYFYYLTGADFPGCSVTYDIAADKLTLWIPFTPPATILWFGTTPSPEDCLAKSEVHDVKYIGELSGYLSSRMAEVKTLYALRPSQLPRFDGFDQMKSSVKVDVTSLQPAMDEARLIKSEHEVAMIRKANDVSSAAHRRIATRVGAMKNECEIEAAFVAACTAANAHSQAYPVIAGSGPNASTLHYEANNESLSGRQLVVLDAGAEWSCYASDVTRMLPVGPRSRFSAEARAVYDLVHRMQDECIALIKPGVVFRDLQLHATLVAVQGLLELGVLRNGTAEEIFKNGTGAAFFPHGVGHHVGLDCHELVPSSSFFSVFTPPSVPFKPLSFLRPQPHPPVPLPPPPLPHSSCASSRSRSSNIRFRSVLSRDLLRPAGEGMWGKRRPIGPQSVRAMIKQAANEASASAASDSSASSGGSSNASPQNPTPPDSSSPTQSGAPPLPPRSTPPPSTASAAEKAAAEAVAAAAAAVSSPTPPMSPLSPTSEAPPPRFTTSPPPPQTPQPQIQTQAPSPQRQQQQSQQGSKKKKRPAHNTLQPGMVVTVEPGVYFCRPYVEAYFLRREEHARYIDAEVLARYWDVGGVRVEDDVLVTEAGFEDLTVAPKGVELLRLMGYA